MLGAGGAARAAVFGLRDRGAEVFILNRTAATAQKLARQSGSKTIKKEALAKTQFDVVLNATPVGMAGNKAQSILEAKELNTRLVFDLIYNPLETPLIHLARQQGIPFITGIEMFVQQGARQFEIFTGKPAPEEEMFRVVLHALRQQIEASAAESTEPRPKAKSAKAAPEEAVESKPKSNSAAPAKAHATKAPAHKAAPAKKPSAPAKKKKK